MLVLLASADLLPSRAGLLEGVEHLPARVLGRERRIAELRARAGALGPHVDDDSPVSSILAARSRSASTASRSTPPRRPFSMCRMRVRSATS